MRVQEEDLKELSDLLSEADEAMRELAKINEEAGAMKDIKDQARFCHEKVMPAMEALRAPIDKAELMVDESMWPMPTYSDLMFEV